MLNAYRQLLAGARPNTSRPAAGPGRKSSSTPAKGRSAWSRRALAAPAASSPCTACAAAWAAPSRRPRWRASRPRRTSHGRASAVVMQCFGMPNAGSWLGCDRAGNLPRLLTDAERIDYALIRDNSPRRRRASWRCSPATRRPWTARRPIRNPCRCWGAAERTLPLPVLAQRGRRRPLSAAHLGQVLDDWAALLVCDGRCQGARRATPQQWCKPAAASTCAYATCSTTRASAGRAGRAGLFRGALGRPLDHRVLPYQRKLVEQQLANAPLHAPAQACCAMLSAGCRGRPGRLARARPAL